jgi:oxygen-independent coproporphyrinogen-3 oxidase
MGNKEVNNNGRRPLGLYIHIPFCMKKCDYCDFLSAPAEESVKKRYFEALLAEIRSYEGKTEGYTVPTIFIGGGTPSCVEAGYIKQILDTVREIFEVSPGRISPPEPGDHFTGSPDVMSQEPYAEISIEVNPGTIDEEKLTVYREAGINRLSFGLQSAEDRELKLLGRIHDYSEFLRNYELARRLGFCNINIDLMSALPGQTLEAWETTLRKVAALEPEHISAYSLIIEEGTPFYERYREGSVGAVELPGEEADREIYLKTKEILQSVGFHRYEISNYSKNGYECRHNLSYWTGVDYLGLGLGASSLLQHTRFHNTSELEEYIELCTIRCKSTKYAHSEQAANCSIGMLPDEFGLRRECEQLSINMQMEEFMFLGLRITKGINRNEFLQRFGIWINTIYGNVIGRLVNQGLMEEKGEYLSLTDYGIDVSNVVLAEFLLE